MTAFACGLILNRFDTAFVGSALLVEKRSFREDELRRLADWRMD